MTVSLRKSIDAIINPKCKVHIMKEMKEVFYYINPKDIPLIIVSPLKTRDNIVQYIVIKFTYYSIQCCTTRGETLDCELFRYLCQLKNEKDVKYNVCHLKLSCERNDFAFLLFLVDFLSNNDNFKTVIPPSDEELEEIYLPMIEPIYTKWTIDETEMYDEILKKYDLPYDISNKIYHFLHYKKLGKK